jgi:hypothetical protein
MSDDKRIPDKCPGAQAVEVEGHPSQEIIDRVRALTDEDGRFHPFGSDGARVTLEYLRYLAKRQEAREREPGDEPFTLAECDHKNVERPNGYRTGSAFEWCADCGALKAPLWGEWKLPNQAEIEQLRKYIGGGLNDLDESDAVLCESCGAQVLHTAAHYDDDHNTVCYVCAGHVEGGAQ